MKDYPQWWEDLYVPEVHSIAEKIGVPFIELMQPWDDLSDEVTGKIKELDE